MIDGVVVIDRDYYNTKEEQFKQVMVFTVQEMLTNTNNGAGDEQSDENFII